MTKSAELMASLNVKQARFVEEYLVDLNATRAAIRAGYSEKSAEVQGHRLLRHDKVAAAISAGRESRTERTQITQDMVLRELAKIGFSDIRKVLTSTGALIDPTEWDDETAGAIASLEVVVTHKGETDEAGRKVPEHVHKIRTWDKLSALEKIGRHLGMFEDKTGGDAEVVADALNNIADKLNG